MKFYLVSLTFFLYSLLHAQSPRKLSREEACNDIDSLYFYYAEQSAMGCNDLIGKEFLRACEMKKMSIRDSVSLHHYALELAQLIAGCHDAHFALDWLYLNRKFPRGIGFLPFSYEITRDATQIQLVVEDCPDSLFLGAEWIDFNGQNISELIEWAGNFVSVEQGAEVSRDYIAASWLPWILAQSDRLKVDNDWGAVHVCQMDTLRSQFTCMDMKQWESSRRITRSRSERSEVTFSIHAEKAILKVSTFAPRNFAASMRKIHRFFKVVKRKKVGSILVDLRNNGGGNSMFVEYLYSFLDTAGVCAPHAIIQRGSPLARKRLQPWIRRGGLRKKMVNDEDARAAFQLLQLPDGACDTVLLHHRMVQKASKVYNGKCWVATNGQTASAAAHFAAIVQRNGRGEIIGQACNANTSDSGGNAMRVILPHSGIGIWIPLIRYINFAVENSVRKPVLPDREIWPSLHDISSNLDTIINQFLQYE